MIDFDPENRIKEVGDNLYCISIGRQSNCAGIACVLASLVLAPDLKVHDVSVDSMGNISSESKYYGKDIPKSIVEAVLSGVRAELERSNLSTKIAFRLIGVLYHPVDSNINMHKVAGQALIKKWGETHA